MTQVSESDLYVETSGQDTSLPLFAAGTGFFYFDRYEVTDVNERTQDGGPGKAIRCFFKNEDEMPIHDSDSNFAPDQHSIMEYLPLQPMDWQDDEEEYSKNIARFQDRLTGSDKSNRPNFGKEWLDENLQSRVELVVTCNPDKKTGQLRNNIKTMKPA